MKFDILTHFPDLIHNYSSESILGRAQTKKIISVRAHNYREYTTDKWARVDDKPYGGGPGMILQVEPVYECLKAIKALPTLSSRGVTRQRVAVGSKRTEIPRPHSTRPFGSLRVARNDKVKVILMDPAGKKFDQALAKQFSKLDQLVIICGRYEGYDARIYKYVDERISVGDFVVAGGELPALTITEAVARLIPGVLGNAESLKEETHNEAGKEYPQYTRPENFMGAKVPPILLSGDHKKIAEWRKKKSK